MTCRSVIWGEGRLWEEKILAVGLNVVGDDVAKAAGDQRMGENEKKARADGSGSDVRECDSTANRDNRECIYSIRVISMYPNTEGHAREPHRKQTSKQKNFENCAGAIRHSSYHAP